jgi:hypothetical protein
MHNPAFYIPDFSELHKATCEFVKQHQGTKGYIDTQPDIGKDLIYALVYVDCENLEEVVVYGIKYDEEYGTLAIAWEHISNSYVIEYTEKDYESVNWFEVGPHCDVHYPATLINIAELIHEYV